MSYWSPIESREFRSQRQDIRDILAFIQILKKQTLLKGRKILQSMIRRLSV